MSQVQAAVETLAERYPATKDHKYVYGTAGFRMHASFLDSIAFKVTLIAILRSLSHEGQSIGVMITASHNPPEDNGVKVVETMGEMLAPEWETIATELANINEPVKVGQFFNNLLQKYLKNGTKAHVVLGRDTRESGLHLLNICKSTLTAFAHFVTFDDFGEITTPQLHYLTRCFNEREFGEPTIEGYFLKLSSTVEKVLLLNNVSALPDIVVDCANGVGSMQLKSLIESSEFLKQHWKVQIVNDNVKDPQALNVSCGADYVKTNQKLPANSSLNSSLGASFDGDADRIVFYFTKNNVFHLLDGDRIATLLAGFINQLVSQLEGIDVTMGIIQTAYANGASTNFISSNLSLPVVCTKTGVKHLHHAALEFDVGVYFEANGHGTVLFSPELITKLLQLNKSPARDTLLLLVDLINQTVGDSISDLLAVLVSLCYLNQGPVQWYQSYSDLPNKLYKVLVKDRFAFKTTDAERKLVEPAGMQSQIDTLVQTIDGAKGRSFVRASGTEDAVRVYAEASTPELCAELGDAVVQLVQASNYD